MSAQLLEDLINWRLTPVGQELSLSEFVVLIAIADRVFDPEGNEPMRKFKADQIGLYERIRLITGLKEAGLQNAFRQLAGRGLEVRKIRGYAKDGRPIFGAKGQPIEFRFPTLPASVSLPKTPLNPVDKPCGKPPELRV